MGVRSFVIDAWTALSHKTVLGDGDVIPGPEMAPTWVSRDERRRMAAYMIRAAYLRNSARHYVVADESRRRNHREYGDARGLAEAIRSAIIGDGWQLVVDGADDELALYERGDRERPEHVTEDDVRAAVAATDRQEWLREEWARPERFGQHLIETERNATGIGDGVYYVTWSARKRRVRLHSTHPQFYFPVLTHRAPGDYPRRVHVAYEFEVPGDRDDGPELWVRRQTWDMGPILPMIDEETNDYLRTPDGEFVLYPGDRWEPDPFNEGAERIVRDLPWSDEPVDETCYYTDAEWQLRGLDGRGVDDFDPRKAIVRQLDDGARAWRVDLGIDFVPVVHVPNTVALEEHFGESVIDNVAQLLDDIAASDTDLAALTATLGKPPVGVDEGVAGADGTGANAYKAGQLVRGKVQALDFSTQATALVTVIRFLLERTSTNARVPEEVLGRVGADSAVSGVALLLSFTPFRSIVEEARLVRDDKYELLLKFVQRLSLLGLDGPDAMPGGSEIMRARLQLGAYLPTDQAQTAEMLVRLLDAHGISRRTALVLLVAAGLELPGSIAEELRAIEREDLEAAAALLDLTDDVDLVADRLGVKISAAARAGAAPPNPADLPEGEPLPDVRPAGGGGPAGTPAPVA